MPTDEPKSLLERQAALYNPPKDQTAKHLERDQPLTPPGPRAMSQEERQALTYKQQPAAKVEPGAYQKFRQETGLGDEQARKVMDWLLADERK